MGSKTNYTGVGIAVLLLAFSGLMVFLWLSVGFDKKKYTLYHIYMNEAVYGLAVQSLVKFNGVDVGSIRNISIDKHNPQQVLILVKVDDLTPITTSTTAVIQSQGLTGLRYIELHAGNSGAELLTAITGEDYPVIPSRPSLMLQLNTILSEVTDNFQQVTDAIGSVLDKDNVKAMKNSLRNIDRFTSVLSKQSKQMASIIENVNVLVKNSAIASKALPKLMTTVSGSGRAITQMSNSVTQTMKGTQTAMDQISIQTLPKVNSLMTQLEDVTQTISELAKELKRNPAMLIRGKAPRVLGPGE